MKNRFRALGSSLIVLTSFILSGCSSLPAVPTAPAEPVTRWQTIEEAAKFDQVVVGRHEWRDASAGSPDIKGRTFGVDAFGGSVEGSGLATNTLTRQLERSGSSHGYKVVDRSKWETLRSQIDAIRRDESSGPESEKYQRIGELLNADYLLVGSVTQHRSDQQTVYLRLLADPAEFERYERDYATFKDEIAKAKREADSAIAAYDLNPVMGSGAAYARKNEIELREREVRTPQAVRNDIEMKTKPEFASLAQSGIEARLIDCRTGENLFWYTANVNAQTSSRGLDQLIEDLVQRISSANAN
ncbi:MAG: CsgG/HfaB family protein [Phycisphaerales bacterium]